MVSLQSPSCCNYYFCPTSTRNKEKKEHFCRGVTHSKRKKFQVDGEEETLGEGEEGEERDEVSPEPDAEGPKHQVREYDLGPADTGAMQAEADRTRFYTGPTLGHSGHCSVEQDQGLPQGSYRPIRREGTTWNDLTFCLEQSPST